MSDFQQQPDELEAQLNNLFNQMAPDRLPNGFSARTMAAIRPQVDIEPFRLHWSDFVPAFVAAGIGAVVLFIWLGAAGAHSSFDWAQADGFLAPFSEVQLTIGAMVMGLLFVTVPLLRGNLNRQNVWFLSAVT
ncbi:MAG: hypothetical protein AAGD96_26220 [Chloroflexota bacterium]